MTFAQALEFFGSKAAMAKELDVSPQAVQQWDDAEKIPRGRQFEIQVITNGALLAEKHNNASAA